MRWPVRTALATLFAVAVAFAFGSAVASARTYDRGHTVFFKDVSLGNGDEVRGDLEIVYGKVTCNAGAVVDGNVRTYFATFDQLDGCRVAGRVIDAFSPDELSAMPWLPRGSTLDFLGANRQVLEHLAWDVVVLLIFLLFPLRVRIALDRVERNPGLSALVGTIALIAVLPVLVLLLVSVIGIPLIVIEFAALMAGIWIGQAAVAMLVGRRLCELIAPRTTPSPLAALFIGLVLVGAAQSLPVIGWVVSALVWIVGLGAVILAYLPESHFRGPIGGLPANRTA